MSALTLQQFLPRKPQHTILALALILAGLSSIGCSDTSPPLAPDTSNEIISYGESLGARSRNGRKQRRTTDGTQQTAADETNDATVPTDPGDVVPTDSTDSIDATAAKESTTDWQSYLGQLAELFARKSLEGVTDILHFHAVDTFSPDRLGVLMIDRYRMTFFIPAGALSETTEICADVWIAVDEGQSESIMFEFGPAYAFLKPIQLSLGLEYADALRDENGDYILWFWDPVAEAWGKEDVGTISILTQQVTFEISHFSKYAIGRF